MFLTIPCSYVDFINIPGWGKNPKKNTKKQRKTDRQTTEHHRQRSHPSNRISLVVNLAAPVSTEVGKTQECGECHARVGLMWKPPMGLIFFPPGKKKGFDSTVFFFVKKRGVQTGVGHKQKIVWSLELDFGFQTST